MKIETRDMVRPEPQSEPKQSADRGLVARAALAVLLAGLFLVTLNWAVNLTNANARQVSSNLSSLSGRFEPAASASRRRRAPRDTAPQTAEVNDGPILEPVDTR
jgi:hypothetical protein